MDATPFRALVRYLTTTSALPWRAIALHADVPTRTVDTLIHGRNGRQVRRLPPDVARRLLSVHPATLSSLERRAIPIASTTGSVRRLRSIGHSTPEIARRCGLCCHEVDALAEATVGFTSARTALVVAALADEMGVGDDAGEGAGLWPPSRCPRPRAAGREPALAILSS